MMHSILLIIAAGLLAQTAPLQRNFDAEPADAPPPGFEFEEKGRGPDPEWRIVAGVAEEGGQVLSHDRQIRRSSATSLAILKNLKLEDVRISVRIKAVAGDQEQTGGIVWRYSDDENYLLARLDVSDNRLRLYRVFNGNRITLGREDDVPLERNRWYTLRVDHRGNRILVYLDGNVRIFERNRHFRRPGKVGLWAKGDATTLFDDLTVIDLDDDRDRRDRRDSDRRGNDPRGDGPGDDGPGRSGPDRSGRGSDGSDGPGPSEAGSGDDDPAETDVVPDDNRPGEDDGRGNDGGD